MTPARLAALLQDDDCAAVAVEWHEIPAGDAGARYTVGLMAELIAVGQGHPIVRRHAEQALRGVPHEPEAELRAIVRYLRARTQYLPDPAGNEQLQKPWWVLHCQIASGHRARLDCDDLTTLSLSLLAAIGFPVAIRLVSMRPDGAFNHVLGEVAIDDETWVRVDLTDYPSWSETRAEVYPV